MEMVEQNKNQLILVAGALLILILLSLSLPRGVDWQTVYYRALREMLQWRSPYIRGFMNPPWTLWPLLPLGLLPEHVGRGVLAVAGLCSYAYIAHRMTKGIRISVVLFLLSPPVLHCLLNSNLDWLCLLGLVLPIPTYARLFFLTIKPQMTIGILVWELWEAIKEKRVIKTFSPVSLALAASFLLYGLWPLRFLNQPAKPWNASLWPLSIPIGLALMVYALRKNDIRPAIAASPCLAPYVLFHSWAGILLTLSMPEMVAAVTGLWIVVFLH